MTNKYPAFISRLHVIAFIESEDPDFAKQLTDKTQSFAYGDFFFTPALDNYLLRIPFCYNPHPKEFGVKQFKEFNRMKNEVV